MKTDPQALVQEQAKPGRRIYRLTADQVFRMVECGILPEGGPIELWNGVLYRTQKSETHNVVVAMVADLLRAFETEGMHVREEKTFHEGRFSLPEPDVALVRGGRFSFLPHVPPLSSLALAVEVSQNTHAFDAGPRLKCFAEVGIPVYWIVEIDRRSVSIHTRPVGAGKSALYAHVETFLPGQSFPVMIDGTEVGRIAVDDLFPPVAKG